MAESDIDWIRNDEGEPKRMRNGSFVLIKSGGVCFAIFPQDINRLIDLSDEIELYATMPEGAT